jgi:hypothetical protein
MFRTAKQGLAQTIATIFAVKNTGQNQGHIQDVIVNSQ